QGFANRGISIASIGTPTSQASRTPSAASGITVAPSGIIYVDGTSGYEPSSESESSYSTIWAFDQNGIPDVNFKLSASTFGYNRQLGFPAYGNDIIYDSSGKIIVLGSVGSSTINPYAWRYLANGSLDSSFGASGAAKTSYPGADVYAYGIAEDLVNGGFFLTGGEDNGIMTLSKLTATGGTANAFSGDGRLDFPNSPYSQGQDVVVDSLGRVIVAGVSRPNGGDSNATVWRYLANGNLDTTFNGTGYITLDGGAGLAWGDDMANSLALDASGDIFIAGSSMNASDNLDVTVWKITATTGLLDTTFNGTGYISYHGSAGDNGNDVAADLTLDVTGNLWLTGYSVNASGNKDMCIWNLLSDGSLNMNFNKSGIFCHDHAAGGNVEQGNAIFIDSSDRVLVAGEASNGYITQAAIWRLGATSRINGTVTIQGSGLPLAGAIISLPGYGTAVTDASGNYEFRFIAVGDVYDLSASYPGYTFAPATHSGVAAGNIIHDFTAVVSPVTYNITGTVTENGVPFAGATIDGGALGSTTSAADGKYSFNNVPIGTNYTLTPSEQSALFFPAHHSGILTADVTHDFDVIDSHHDAIFSLSGRVTFGGSNLSGITVNGGALGTRTTDSNGLFSFTGLAANTSYSLTLSGAGYTFIPGSASGTIYDNTIHNFSAQLATYSLSGTVTAAGQALSGTIINGGALGFTITDASGHYQFNNVTHGSVYSITPAKIGYNFSPVSATGTLTANATKNFTANQLFYTLTGTVTENGKPVPDVVVSGGAIGNRLTNSLGKFSYSLPYGTVYNLALSKTGMIISPSTASGTTHGTTSLAFTASKTLHTISGSIAESGVPLAGVLVSGGALGNRTTDASGAYSFNNVSYGTAYSITPSLSGYTFGPYQATGTVTSNKAHNFTATVGEPVDLGQNLSGKIKLTNLDGSPLGGVTVSVGGRSAVSDNNGNYTVTLVPPGTYEVSAELNGYNFSSDTSPVTVNNQPLIGVDFAASPKVSNPAYALWNGFLGMINILEIMNTSEEPLTISLTVFTNGGTGNPITRTWSVPAMTQRDIILNDLHGFEKDTYGMFKVECSHNNFDGRVSLYYPDTSGAPDAQYGFAYSEALRNLLHGQSAVMYNTYHPGANTYDSKNTVYNWLTIANLDDTSSRKFTVKRYDMNGTYVRSERVSVPPLGRIDVDGGHVNPGPDSVGTNIIAPDSPNAPYLANLVRYAEGSNFDAFDYAMTLPAEGGFPRAAHLPISVELAATNYLEVANILDKNVNITLTYTDSDGYNVGKHTIKFPPLTQRHFPTAGMLLDTQSGFVKLESDIPGSILAQSVFYHHDMDNRSIQTAYASPAREIFGEKLYTTYNTFLNMKNYLRLMNIASEESLITYSFPDGASRANSAATGDEIRMPKNSSVILNLASPLRDRSIDSYGLVSIDTNLPGSIAAELIRYRVLENRKIEFAIDSQAR
ncbi:MAG: carboxypeptidase regulatory-like domain-containing protein, partial [bacterium]|nr:carboxypeptidase regulatory-like domain-containing protein [bacterium]